MAEFNSYICSFANIKVNLFGRDITGLRGLKYKRKQEKTEVYANDNDPVAIVKGKRSYEGTLDVLQAEYHALDLAAKAAGYRDLLDVPAKFINITVVYQTDERSLLKTDKLLGVAFTDSEDGLKEGDTFTTVSLPFKYLKSL